MTEKNFFEHTRRWHCKLLISEGHDPDVHDSTASTVASDSKCETDCESDATIFDESLLGPNVSVVAVQEEGLVNISDNGSVKGEPSNLSGPSVITDIFPAFTEKDEKDDENSGTFRVSSNEQLSTNSAAHFGQEMESAKNLNQNDGNQLSKNTVPKRVDDGTTKKQSSLCEWCGKRFSRAAELQRHERMHTGEKPFKCSVCSRDFARSGTLKNHLRTHSGSKPYKCKICHKGFSQPGNMKSHLSTHTGEQPFVCEYCGKRFTHLSSCYRHRSRKICQEERYSLLLDNSWPK